MKVIKLFQYIIIACVMPLVAFSQDKTENFKFAFLTDIHLSLDRLRSENGFQAAIDTAIQKNADLIITGGDNIDIDGTKDTTYCLTLYKEYYDFLMKQDIKIYPTIGNHDRYWAGGIESLHNAGLFESYFSKSYKSFDHKGWHFMILNSVEVSDGKYVVGEDQKNWIVKDLERVDPATPIVVSVHVPFLSLYYAALEGKITDTDTFANFKEIWDLFNDHNLKLVLQGHQHLYEEINILDVQFITGGAVSASWWGGPFHGTEEGFLLVHVDGEEFSWEYVDYGWIAK